MTNRAQHTTDEPQGKKKFSLESRPTRSERYLSLLRAYRKRPRPEGVQDWPEGLGWVPLPDVQREAGAQHGARKQELEQRGHVIENFMRRQPNGEVCSWYRLVHDAEEQKAQSSRMQKASAPSASLFSPQELELSARWEDHG